MTRSNPIAPSHNAGELTQRLAARLDFSKYGSGLELCQNLIPLAEGGLMRRSGGRFVREIKDSAVQGRLERFEFSTTQAYQIEMGANVFRFHRNQGTIIVPTTTAVITNGTFTGNITGWDNRSTGAGTITHDATNNRLNLNPNGTGATDIGWAEQNVTNNLAQEHVLRFQVLGMPSDRIQLRIGSATLGTQFVNDVTYEVGYHSVAFTPTAANFFIQFRNLGSFRNKTVQIDNVSLLSGPIELTTPYAETDLPLLEGPQSADVRYLFHGSFPTYKLQRHGHTSWSLVEVAWQDGPWMPKNEGLTATTLAPAAASGLGVNVTASSTAGINNNRGFLATDVGRLIRIDNPASGVNWGWAIIRSVTSTTVVVVDIRRAFAATTAVTKWRLGIWSGTTGYPSTANFYQQRLIGANTTDKPQTFWGSSSADFEIMSPDSPNSSGAWAGTVEADDALDYTISAENVNAIQWIAPGKGTLAIGTVGGEWTVSSTGAVITPTDVVVDPATSHGSSDTLPMRVGNVILFVQRARRKVREFQFDFATDGYQAFDMTRLAEHITRSGIVEMDYAEEPNALIWARRSDGLLVSMTYRREEDVVGWARHPIGGSFAGGAPVVESVSVIPGTAGAGQVQSSENRNEVWYIVKRTINGQTKRYIEVLEADWDDSYAQEDAYYADSLITYDGAPTAAISGLGHLEGQEVVVLADGAVHPRRTVSGGSIALDDTYSVVQVGLPYKHRLRTLKLLTGAAAGTPAGKVKQIFALVFVLLYSHTIGYGPDEDRITNVDFRDVEDLMDTAVPFFTGEFRVEWDDDWDMDPRIEVQSEDPVPFNLLALLPEVDTRELI